MSIEEKFNAAVNVIRGLPKSGSYQPSNELMLRFYSYFKQATEGACDKPKPAFWDVVNRAKWEAWNRLGNMTKEEAMQAYVDELHTIVETMSYTADVASFVAATDSEVKAEDLELVAGDVLQRVRSEHNTPIGSREVSRTPSPQMMMNSQHHDSEDEFSDTIEQENQEAPSIGGTRIAQNHLNSNGSARFTQSFQLKVLETLPDTLSRLERDVAALRHAVEGDRKLLMQKGGGWRWPWQELSPPTLAFVLLWPIVAYRIQRAFQRK